MKCKVALLGACGNSAFTWAAQMVLRELRVHPEFELAALVAERPEDENKNYPDAVQENLDDQPIGRWWEKLKILPADGHALREQANVSLVLSSLPPDASRALDQQLAETGMPVVSASSVWRDEGDIPLIVPEVNSDHLSLIPTQKQNRGWRGFIVSNPVSTTTILSLSLKPILNEFGIERVLVTTLQAASGAGPNGPPSMDMIDNLIPFINDEEEKVHREGAKIFGKLDGTRILPADFKISATCTRVPVLFGHMATVFIECKRRVSVEEVSRAFQTFSGARQRFDLSSAPAQTVIVNEAPDRPQPRLDRQPGGGMAIMVGRIHVDSALPNGIKYVVTGHHLHRGTAGNNLLIAELLYKKGLIG